MTHPEGKKILVVGSGYQALFVVDILNENNCFIKEIAVIDIYDEKTKLMCHPNLKKYFVGSVDNWYADNKDELDNWVFCRGVGDNRRWYKWRCAIEKLIPSVKQVSVIAKSAEIAETATIVDGVTIHQRVHISADAYVDAGTVLNINVVIGHGSKIGKDCNISPNTVVCANVNMGDGVYTGVGVMIAPEISIQAKSFIKLGEVIKKDR